MIEEISKVLAGIMTFIAIIIIAAIILASFIFIIAGVAYPFEKKSCKDTANIMNVEWDYRFFTDCMVKIDDKFVPLDQYLKINNK